MKKRPKRKRGKKLSHKGVRQKTNLSLYAKVGHSAKEIEKLMHHVVRLQDRLEDVEIHVNLITRLISTLCVEKLGMRIGVLKRLLKRVEKEAIRDSQIVHLESIYNLPHSPKKKSHLMKKPTRRDPWDEIS